MNKAVGIIGFFLFLSIGANVWHMMQSSRIASTQTKVSNTEFQYLSPLVSEYPNDLLLNFLPLRKSVREAVQTYGDSFSLYFEYLPTGTSIGIHEKTERYAASLLKLPVVMAYYHQKERGKSKNKTVTIVEDQLDPAFGQLWKKGTGATISLDEAAQFALQESDNTALRILTDNIDVEDFEYVYEGLDIDLKEKDGGIVLTAKQYASILKALHFSALLTNEHSEEILSLMTKTLFTDMLPAGVPKDVAVAHKIGVLANNLYMDCGIVYHPNRPYLVCMMSESTKEEAQKRMKEVSQLIYSYVHSQKVSKDTASD